MKAKYCKGRKASESKHGLDPLVQRKLRALRFAKRNGTEGRKARFVGAE